MIQKIAFTRKHRVFDQFPEYCMLACMQMLADVKAKVGNESLHEVSNDNRFRVVNFATSKNLTVESTMFTHCNIHKCTWTFYDGKTYNHIYQILIGKGQKSGSD